jgi:hypothetical protein
MIVVTIVVGILAVAFFVWIVYSNAKYEAHVQLLENKLEIVRSQLSNCANKSVLYRQTVRDLFESYVLVEPTLDVFDEIWNLLCKVEYIDREMMLDWVSTQSEGGEVVFSMGWLPNAYRDADTRIFLWEHGFLIPNSGEKSDVEVS